MAASVVQSAGSSVATDPATVVLGATPTAGNTLLAVMSSDTTIQTSTFPTAGAGRNYTLRGSRVANQGFYVWTRLVTSGDSATTSFDIAGANPGTYAVAEIAGTYDTIGTITFAAANGLNLPITGLTPGGTDNLVVAIVGGHSVSNSVPAAETADNGFTVFVAQDPPSVGGTRSAVILASKATGSTSATGTTTISWTGAQIFDRDGFQISFLGISSGSAVNADFTGSGTLAAAVVETERVAAGFTGSGTLSAAVAGIPSVTAAFTGSGTLAAAIADVERVSANFNGSGTLTAIAGKAWSNWRNLVNAALTAQTMSTLVVGDSISEGEGASARANRWVDKMNDALKALYQPGGVTGASTGYLPGYYAANTIGNPYTSTSGFSEFGANSLGERSMRATGTATQVYTVTGTSADLLAASGGTYSWAVDGGSTTNVSPGANSKTHISLGSAGSHTITIRWVSGTVTFGGVVVFNGDEASGIRVLDASHYSWMTTDFSNDLPAIYNTVSPDVVLFATGINDTQTDAQIKANVQGMIADTRAACTKEPACLVVIMYQPSGRSDWATTVTELRAIATDDPTVGIIDYYALMGTATTSGYWTGDGLHPSNSGHAYMGTQAAAVLQMTPTVTAAFTGSGTLTAAVVETERVAAGFTGSGTLTATVAEVEQVAANFNGSGTLTAAVVEVERTPANFTGSGTLTANIGSQFAANADFTGSGTLTATTVEVERVAATFTGSGTLTATSVEVEVAAAAFTGTGNLTAVTIATHRTTATFTGSGTLAATASAIVAVVAGFNGTGALVMQVGTGADRDITFTGRIRTRTITGHLRG